MKTAKTRDSGVATRRIIRTFGEIFIDGSVLELVASENANHLNLMLWNRKRKVISSQIARAAQQHHPSNTLPA